MSELQPSGNQVSIFIDFFDIRNWADFLKPLALLTAWNLLGQSREALSELSTKSFLIDDKTNQKFLYVSWWELGQIYTIWNVKLGFSQYLRFTPIYMNW